jgi:hypothetical protein
MRSVTVRVLIPRLVRGRDVMRSVMVEDAKSFDTPTEAKAAKPTVRSSKY